MSNPPTLFTRWNETGSPICIKFTTLNVDLTTLEMRYYYKYRAEVVDTIALFNTIYDHPLQELATVDNLMFIRHSTVTSFFSALMVDMPICLQKSKSLFSRVFELPFLKMTNMVMRAGRRAKVLKYLSWSFAHVLHRVTPLLAPTDYLEWGDFYTLYLISSLSVKGLVESAYFEGEMTLAAKNTTEERGLTPENPFLVKTYLFEQLSDIAPSFSFYVRRLDKNVRKNSRGKSGKYVLIWKYIPRYRRVYTTLRWLIQDFHFQRSRTFSERWVKALEVFLLSPKQSLIGRMRKFLHFWVFENYKKTLLKTLRSTS